MVVGVVDLGVGNISAVTNLLQKIGVESVVVVDPESLEKVSRIILPGVGSYDTAMRNLNSVRGIRATLEKKVLDDGVPVLGLCLGLQIFTHGSEEGKEKGLGWVDAICHRFPLDSQGLKVPHIGWAGASDTFRSRLLTGLTPDFRFYYAHSYYVKCQTEAAVAMRTSYGVEFDSVIEIGNIYGVQFHPEKSHRHGERVVRNFIELEND